MSCRPPTRHFRCTDELESTRLCQAVANVSHARCERLRNEEYIADVIRSAGLVATIRGCRLYGAECKYMHTLTETSERGGFFQLPRQIASAMVYLGRLGIGSYLELGVYSGWTACLMTAYLERFSPTPFRSFALDQTDQFIGRRTASMMKLLGVEFHLRPRMSTIVPAGLEASLQRLEKPVGLCFIDAGHSYTAVRQDFERFSSLCSSIIFHDTFDFDLWATKDHGVPGFWHHLKANVASSRIVEFHGKETVFPPTLGLGLVLPDANGSASVALTRPWHVGGAFAQAPTIDALPCTGIGCSYDLGACFDEGPGQFEFCPRYSSDPSSCPPAKAQYTCQKTCGWCPFNTSISLKHRRRAGTMSKRP